MRRVKVCVFPVQISTKQRTPLLITNPLAPLTGIRGTSRQSTRNMMAQAENEAFRLANDIPNGDVSTPITHEGVVSEPNPPSKKRSLDQAMATDPSPAVLSTASKSSSPASAAAAASGGNGNSIPSPRSTKAPPAKKQATVSSNKPLSGDAFAALLSKILSHSGGVSTPDHTPIVIDLLNRSATWPQRAAIFQVIQKSPLAFTSEFIRQKGLLSIQKWFKEGMDLKRATSMETMLKTLDGLPVTMASLQAPCDLAKMVNMLKKDPALVDVHDQAKKLVAKWKAIVAKATPSAAVVEAAAVAAASAAATAAASKKASAAKADAAAKAKQQQVAAAAAAASAAATAAASKKASAAAAAAAAVAAAAPTVLSGGGDIFDVADKKRADVAKQQKLEKEKMEKEKAAIAAALSAKKKSENKAMPAATTTTTTTTALAVPSSSSLFAQQQQQQQQQQLLQQRPTTSLLGSTSLVSSSLSSAAPMLTGAERARQRARQAAARVPSPPPTPPENQSKRRYLGQETKR